MKNLIWVVPDSVRSMKHDDVYGRFDFFEEIKQDGFFEFTNTYTAHPSTFMSFSSFLRGIYATKIASRYGELKALKSELPTIDKKLKEQGYNIYFLTFYPDELRQQVDNDIFDLVENKDKLYEALYEESVTGYNDYIEYFLKNEKLKEPYCLLLHFNAPGFVTRKEFFNYDYNNYFTKIYNLLKPKMENSITIINSDHGFPIYKDTNDYKQAHEEFLTQENIKPIFFMKIPNRQISDIDIPVSLVDIYPTLADIFNFKLDSYIDGISLLDAIEKQNLEQYDRFLRVENKFNDQDNARIAYIKGNKKIVLYRDIKEFKVYTTNGIEEIQCLNNINTDIKDFLRLEKIFNTEREFLIEDNFYKKNQKLEKLLTNNKVLFIKTIDNEFVENFLVKFGLNGDIINLKDIKHNIQNKYDFAVLIVHFNLLIDEDIMGIELYELKKLKVPLYIIDTYSNIEEVVVNIKAFLYLKHKLYLIKKKRSSRTKEQRLKMWFENK